jgi:enhancing lycopene biosynthesis protein 2
MKIGVLLSGCGVYDGSEIHESVFTLLAIAENGGEAICMAPNMVQHHVINHLTGDEMKDIRNVLTESARIARGKIQDISKVNISELDALVIPGGFGTAKNHTKWAFEGPDGEIVPDVMNLIRKVNNANKPIVGLCMAPTTIAKALENSGVHAKLTVGTTEEKSPYDIEAISDGMEKIGAIAQMKTVKEINIDFDNRIITAPCYMMEANIVEVKNNIDQAIKALFKMLEG